MSLDIDGEPLSTVVFDGKYIIMDSPAEDEPGGRVSGNVEQGNGARVDVIKRQKSFMEKLIGVKNAQCELYLATVNRALDKHATHSLRAIQSNTNQLKYDYKLMQVSQQRNDLAAKQRAQPELDLEYEEFLIQQTQKYLIYNPNICSYTNKAMRYPTRSGIQSSHSRITPTLAKARKTLQETVPAKPKPADTSHDHRNVHFHLSRTEREDEGSGGGGHESFSATNSSSNPDEYISQDPDKLFLPPQPERTVTETTMEQFKKRLHMRHMLENMEMAPYQGLLDENKELKKYPDPTKFWAEQRQSLGVSTDKERLPSIYHRSQTTTPHGRSRTDPTLLRSRSDTFFHEAVDVTDTSRLAYRSASHSSRNTSLSSTSLSLDKHPKKQHPSRGSSVSQEALSKSAQSRPMTTKSARAIKTRPVTHAMLKREKTQLNLKLGTFFNKLDEERKKEHTRSNSSAGGNRTNKESTLPTKPSTQQTNLNAGTNANTSDAKISNTITAGAKDQQTRVQTSSFSSTFTNKATVPTSKANATGSSDARSPPKQPLTVSCVTPRRGMPCHAAGRSQRHTATEKLRRVVAALMNKKSKAELLQMAKLREDQQATTTMQTVAEGKEEQETLTA